jgi:hypothetical protein
MGDSFSPDFMHHGVMVSTDLLEETIAHRASSVDTSSFFLLRGREDILRMRDVLTRLSFLCDQTGAMDYLDHFITATENLKKTPYLVLISSRQASNPYELQAEDLRGAVLVYEYRMLGISSKVMATDDMVGSRTVVAPSATRAEISAMTCQYLAKSGARIVLLSFKQEADDCGLRCAPVSTGKDRLWWANQRREVPTFLVLHDTLDDTLATMGKHTRRNLRYYLRKAKAELNASFDSDAIRTLTEAEIVELNSNATHPVDDAAVRLRYKKMQELKGAFCVGVKGPQGQWISLLGGRRHHGVTEIDWQTNRKGLEKFSVGTVIRAYFLQHEIDSGTRKLFFEGGTPHSMRFALTPERAVDVVVIKRSPLTFLLRRFVPRIFPEKNFLRQTLTNPEVEWRLQ